VLSLIERHALFPEEDCQGNIGFEGWIKKGIIVGKRNVQTSGE
jgi:hypothetical protein